MEALKSSFLGTSLLLPPPLKNPSTKPSKHSDRPTTIVFSITPDRWSLSDGNNSNRLAKPKPKSKNPKNPLSDDNARRIIKGKARYLSTLRRNQGSGAQTPKWIKRTPEQMVQYLEDDKNGHLYGRHVVAAIRIVRSLSAKAEGSYDMRQVMSSFVTKLTFREMCVVLKEQRGWRQVRDFFAWMKLQLSYRPSVIVYTIVLRVYGQVGKIQLAEQMFLEMLEVGCEPDEVACGTMLCSYARWGRHKAMLSFYSAVQDRGIVLSISVYNFMLSSLQKKSFHGKVVMLWRQMVDKRVVPNHFSFTVVITSLVKEGLSEEAFKTFDEMKSFGFVPEEVTYSLLISLSSKNSRLDEALRLYEEMRCRGITPSNYTCASLLTLYYKCGDYPKAIGLFQEMERNKIKADEVIYGLLIRIYGKLGLYEDAQKTFEEIEKLNMLSEDKTYLAMAQVHLNSGNFEKALITMEIMRSRDILFSRFAYIVMLQCYVMKKDLESAEITFHTLYKTGIPDSGSCNDMLNLFLQLDLIGKAKDFIGRIKNDFVEFDEELCKTVMKVYCKEGMVRDAEQLIEEMDANGSLKDSNFIQTLLMVRKFEKGGGNFYAFKQPDAMALGMMISLYLYNGNDIKRDGILKSLVNSNGGGVILVSQLISKFAREGDISKAESLHDALIKLGFEPGDRASASLISLCGRKQKLEQAQRVFAALENFPTTGKLVYNSMIDAYVKCNKPEKAYSLYIEVTQKGQELGAVAVSLVVNSLSKNGEHQEAENTIRKSFLEGLELDTVAYNTFIKAMLEAGKLKFATTIFEHMLSSGVTPSIQTYNTMISVYGRDRNLDKAVEVFDMASNLGVPLDEKAYANLISYYGKAGKSHQASILFTTMQERGIKPGKVTYNIMINVYAAVGLHQEAEKLYQCMQKDSLAPDSLTFLALIKAYTAGLKYTSAEETLILMQKIGIPPSCAHFNLILTAYSKEGLTEDAERIYKELSRSGLCPDLACNRTMLRAYFDYGHVAKGISFFERLKESMERDRFAMSAAVLFYRSVGIDSLAEEILNSMNSFGVPFLKNIEIGSKVKANA